MGLNSQERQPSSGGIDEEAAWQPPEWPRPHFNILLSCVKIEKIII